MSEAIGFDNYARKRILEVGCGAGIDSAEFAMNGADVTAVDFTDSAILLTKETFEEAGLTAEIIKCDARNLEFSNNTFDVVYSFGVLHHIIEIDRVLWEITRVLRKGGEGIFMVYNKDSLLNAFSILYLHRNEGLSESELSFQILRKKFGKSLHETVYKKRCRGTL